MQVAIVGAGGFIGQHLSAAMAKREIEVVAISSKGSEAFDQQTGILFDRLSAGRPIDAMIYLSQSPHYRHVPQQAPHLWGVNVVSAVKAAEWARRAGARCIVHASTGNVYLPSFTAHAESDPIRRNDWYALSKVHAEEALRLLPDVSVTSVRLFGVYGPPQRSKLIPNLADAIRSGERIRLHPHPSDRDDAGGLRLSLTHVDDVVRVVLHVITAGGPPVLNVAGPEVLSVRDIASAIGRRLGVEPAFEVDPAPRTCDFIADNSLASTLVGGAFTDFASGIGPTIDELRLPLARSET
jgi:UDP-glucose 4-epimerase